jgi:hypothetical protein
MQKDTWQGGVMWATTWNIQRLFKVLMLNGDQNNTTNLAQWKCFEWILVFVHTSFASGRNETFKKEKRKCRTSSFSVDIHVLTFTKVVCTRRLKVQLGDRMLVTWSQRDYSVTISNKHTLKRFMVSNRVFTWAIVLTNRVRQSREKNRFEVHLKRRSLLCWMFWVSRGLFFSSDPKANKYLKICISRHMIVSMNWIMVCFTLLWLWRMRICWFSSKDSCIHILD